MMHSGLTKVHYTDDQSTLLQALGLQVSTVFEDRYSIKQASNAISREMLRTAPPPRGMFGLHITIVGDEETYGQNRNGDSFPKKACAEYHPTFVTHGAMYREHRNRGKENEIGQIKLSAYNERQGRIELFLWGDMQKAADVFERHRAGKETSYSMSCRVPDDECSCCGNKAASQRLYCDHLKNNMNRWLPEFRKYAFARNHKPTFFDASYVERPADRIAHYLRFIGENEMAKAASADLVVPGVEWARYEGVLLPGDVAASVAASRFAKIASTEPVDSSMWRPSHEFVGQAYRQPLELDEWKALKEARVGRVMTKLAQRRILLPFPAFAAWVEQMQPAELEKSATFKLARSMLSDLLDNPSLFPVPEFMDSFSPEPEALASKGGDDLDCVLDKMAEKFNCDPDAMAARVIITISIPVSGGNVTIDKSAGDKFHARSLVAAYGAYKLAALDRMKTFHGQEFAEQADRIASHLLRSAV